jgi:hypothetical protein
MSSAIMNLARGFEVNGHLTMGQKELERKTPLEQVQQGYKSLRALVGLSGCAIGNVGGFINVFLSRGCRTGASQSWASQQSLD